MSCVHLKARHLLKNNKRQQQTLNVKKIGVIEYAPPKNLKTAATYNMLILNVKELYRPNKTVTRYQIEMSPWTTRNHFTPTS